jgi:hypothetical protein
MDRNDHDEPRDPTLMGNDFPRNDSDAERDDTLESDLSAIAGARNEPGSRSADRDVEVARAVDRNPADAPGVEDHLGEAAGGISGVLTGAAIGSLVGPIGTVIGGIAGAIGGWWAGKAIADAAAHYTEEDDRFYRERYETSAERLADRGYDDIRPAYQIGHFAGRTPDYVGRSFDEIEPDLERGWSSEVRSRHGEWAAVRDYARDAYARGRDVTPPSDHDVRLAETSDPRALGDGTAITGYATGLEETVDTLDDETRRKSGAERVRDELTD